MTKFQLPTALMGIAVDMVNKGWQPVWAPHRASGSFSPLPGCTGGVPYPTVLAQPSGAHKLAFRPPPSVLIIDVDDYDGKHGRDTIDRAENWLGTLPDTYRVTSRGYDNPSGRYMYRIPDDLVVTDSALYQFRDQDSGRTDVEIVRTGHRFSWAPGDFHYKNDELIVCFDPDGDSMDEMPSVDDLPALPDKWASYFYNPPVPQAREAYSRPSDGADWWLSQADSSLGTDTELAAFAYNMLLSRVPEDEIYEQWNRVSVALDPADPWERKDFDRHVGSRAQGKAADILARQDYEHAWFEGTGADLEDIARRAKETFDNRQSLMAAVTQPVVDFQPGIVQQGLDLLGFVAGEDDEEDCPLPGKVKLEDRLRALDSYQRLLFDQLARTQANKDARQILSGSFEGYEDISALPDPPAPALLVVTGKDNLTTSVVAPKTITVLSGHRAAGKTWIAAAWEAQVIRRGGHVVHLDFERQPHGLVQKLRALGVPAHLIASQLHYTNRLPSPDRLTQDIAGYACPGWDVKTVLFVVDAFRGLQNTVSPDSSANDGDAVEQVYLEYLNPCTSAGATVCLLDHLAKNGNGTTFGSERKESAADVVIKVEQVRPFTKTEPGFSSMTVTKDRYGVIAAGTSAGYLWMPGDLSKSGRSIDEYPFEPELRNWSPLEAEEAAAVELSQKGRREQAVTQVVADNPLRFGPRELGRHVFDVYPDLFANAKAATDFAGRMKNEGKLLKEAGANGKYEIPADKLGVRDVVIDPAAMVWDGE